MSVFVQLTSGIHLARQAHPSFAPVAAAKEKERDYVSLSLRLCAVSVEIYVTYTLPVGVREYLYVCVRIVEGSY